MEFKIFQYPLPCAVEPEELNQCLNSQRVASVKQYFSETGDTPMLIFVVQLVGQSSETGTSSSASRERIDYRKVLPADEYEVFNQLRDLRKSRAEQEGIPVYSIFTNAQLAAMIKSSPQNNKDLMAVEGISTAKAEKYGDAFMVFFSTKEANDES